MATLTNFDIPLFANTALQGLVNTLLPIRAFSTHFSSSGEATNTQVLVPVIANVTATTFGGSYAVSGGTASVITVQINKQKIAPISMTDLQLASSGGAANANTWAYQQGVGLGLAVLQDIWSMLTTANFAQVTAVNTGSIGVAELLAGRNTLNTNKVPFQPRSFVFDVAPYGTLLGISQYAGNLFAFNNSAISGGKLPPQVLGADIYETNSLPGTNSVMGFIAHPSAAAVAMRWLPPQDGNTYFRAEAHVDDATGIVMGLRDFYDNPSGTRYVVLEANYGYAAGLTQCARLYARTN